MIALSLSILGIAVAIGNAELPWYYGRPYPGASTRGGVWPLPWSIQYDNFNHTINPATFRFVSKVSEDSPIERVYR
ncbi:50S ribosomal protein L24 family protein [Cooperia oncophora]